LLESIEYGDHGMRQAFRTTLQEVFSLLDTGVSLYRRHLIVFAGLAGLFSLPAMLVTFSLLFSIGDLSDATFTDFLLVVFGLLLTSLLMIPPLTQATSVALAGQPLSIAGIIWRWPRIGRWLIAFGYGSVLTFIWGFIVLTAGGVLFSVIGCMVFFSLAVITSTTSSLTAFVLLFPLVIVAAILTYYLYLVLCGSSLIAALYAVQPVLDDSISLTQAIGLSWSLLFRRFAYNMLVFLCAALIFSVVATIVTLTVGVLLPAPFGLLLGAEHPLTRGLSAVAWVIGLAAAMPLIPIWSTLHYQQALAERNGADLALRIQQLQYLVTGHASMR